MNYRFALNTFMIITGILITSTVSAENSIKEATDLSIKEIRMGSFSITTKPGVTVRVTQLKHEFYFGAAISNFLISKNANPDDLAMYKRIFKENFNAAVFENALKWAQMEREQGVVDYSNVDNILEWCEHNDIPIRGHCVYWGISGRVPQWQKDLNDADLRRALEQRGLDIGTRYRGRIPEYDLNNEMLQCNYYEERFGPEITADMARWVKSGDPDARIFLNDYDILTGNYLDRYVAQIERFLSQGIPIGGIGVQGHLHGDSFDPEVLKQALDTLARFNLPIKVTEFNMPGQRATKRDRNTPLADAEEEIKAQNLVDYYRICFAHPAVEGILMWGFWQNALWLPNSCLWKADWTPTPAAKAYHDLIFDEWWTTWEGKADENGVCTVQAFFGTYEIAAGSEKVIIEFTKKEKEKTIRIGL